MKPATIALISTAIVATFGVGFLVYYDNKRRSDPNFKKQKKRERKRAAKEEKKVKEQEVQSIDGLIQSVMESVAKEEFPESAEEKEAYFLEKVAAGENLVKQGEAYYNESVEYFYKALKIYPAPLELIMIYQKTLPEKVFRIVVNIMALEQQKRQTQFYDDFPPKELNLKLKQLPKQTSEDEKDLYGLVAEKDFEQDSELYSESPMISVLRPELEGSFCNYCMKRLDDENKLECTNCDKVAFCSKDCEKSSNERYHQFLCVNNKLVQDEKANEFLKFIKENNVFFPQMIAQYLASMVAEELEKNKLGKDAPKYGSWDHIERFKQGNVKETQADAKEIDTIKNLLMSKVPGIDEFLSSEIYLVLKGKLAANTFQIPSYTKAPVTEKSSEHVRIISNESPALGNSIYKISSYLGKAVSEDDANVKIEFKDNSNFIIIKSTKEIKSGDEIKAFYQ